MHKLGMIVPDEDSVKVIRRAYKDEILNGSLVVELMSSDLNEMRMQAVEMEASGCQAIITRGRSHELLVPAVSIPVMKITFTVNDIIQAIAKAQALGGKVALILSYENCPELEGVLDSLKYPCSLSRYHEDHEELEAVRALDVSSVCIGGYYAGMEANRLGIPFVKIEMGVYTVAEMIADTQQMLNKAAEERERNRLYSTILHTINEAVASFDEAGQIVLWNSKAEKLLGVQAADCVGRLCREGAPVLYPSYRKFLSQGAPVWKFILNSRGQHFSVQYQRLSGGEGRTPVLCTFQTIEEIEAQEKSVRMDLHKSGLVAKTRFGDIVRRDPNFTAVLDRARKIAATDGSVLIIGESGTGKEVVAQSIHNASERADGPFVAVNCGAISESLLESELFGYAEGAFTGAKKGGKEGLFEMAHGGTIFFDEINSMPVLLQSKLLRVLQEKEIMRVGGSSVIPVNVRVIAAANEDLYEQMQEQRFRKDLLYRLSTFELVLPPLRERPEDILPLFRQFLKETGRADGIRPLKKNEERALVEYDWPGNARELRNLAERFSLEPSVEDICALIRRRDSRPKLLEPERPKPLPASIDLKEITRSVEQSVIQMLLDRGYSKSAVADMLGISRASLYHYINVKKK